MVVTLLLVSLLGSTLAVPNPGLRNQETKCGYESCTKPTDGALNVHIVPHTHDDVGWLKTVDQYYYGYRNDIQKAGVQYILDSVVKELWEDPARRFIYVESAFFAKWWIEQPQSVKDKVHTLVREGRLKFAGGAWSMNDEAATYYQSTIDQFTFGLSFLNRTFGECGRPRVGWQIDPFGHSRELASLLAAMGYDGLFLGRIDYQDKKQRVKDKTMEFIWRGDDNLGKSSDIFTGVLYNTYSPPPGFCFDVLCNDDPIIDDPDSPDYNVEERVDMFLNRSNIMSKAYTTNNILVTMGDDFNYQDAGMWFKNLDKLIKYTNKRAQDQDLNITLFYSTPDCYLKAVKDANPTLPIKQDDFFPYASDPHTYWTGYFTSRPTVKFLEAEANKYFQMVKQLYVLADLPQKYMKVLEKLKMAMGILQHHDAITGTEKQHVTYDYVRTITAALRDAHDTITTESLNKMILGENNKTKLKFDRCRFNESSCITSENAEGNLIVTVYNPLAWSTWTSISIPVSDDQRYEVRGSDGKWHYAQTVLINEAVLRISSRNSTATHEAVFVDTIPALGYKSYYMRKTLKVKRDLKYFEKFEEYDIIKNHYDRVKKVNPKVSYDDEFDNLLSSDQVPNAESSLSADGMVGDDPMVVERYPFDTEFGDEDVSSGMDVSAGTFKTVLANDKTFVLRGGASYYRGYLGNNMIFTNRSSGAYIFRPEYQTPVGLRILNTSSVDGDMYLETRISMSGNADFAFRSYKNPRIRYGELDWIVGPISDDDGIGKEYIFQYQTNMITNGEFYTDSNGRQILKRKLNQRPQWNLTVEEPVAANYYPIVDYAFVKNNDGKFSLGVLPDRPEGGASLQEGAIELMLHRRLLHDDAFGVGEALNETEEGRGLVVRGTHRVFFDTGDVTFKDVLEMRNKPQVFVSDAIDIDVNTFSTFNTEKSFLKDKIPDGVHLLSLEPWDNNKLLIRFENYLDKSDKSSKTIDLENILLDCVVKSYEETLLTADKLASTYEKWVWNTNEEFSNDANAQYGNVDEIPRAVDRVRTADDGKKINLDAKEIRTFLVEYEISK